MSDEPEFGCPGPTLSELKDQEIADLRVEIVRLKAEVESLRRPQTGPFTAARDDDIRRQLRKYGGGVSTRQ